MIGDHVYVFFTFFVPDRVEKEEDKKSQFSPALELFLFMVDISHMRLHEHTWSTVQLNKNYKMKHEVEKAAKQSHYECVQR